MNAMTAADTVLVPIQCEFYALDGLTQLINTVNLIKNKLNKDLYIEGVVFTMYDARTRLGQDVVAMVKQNIKEKVFDTLIPRNVRLAEAPSNGMSILDYDSGSVGADRYRKLASEILSNSEV